MEMKLDKQTMQRNMVVRIAKMYYYDGMSQQEIADEMQISRSNVSRILKIARDMGIVDIRINDASVRSFMIQEQLKGKFGLKEMVIAPSNNDPEVNVANIGFYAARHLEKILRDNMKVGVTWGSSIYHMLSSLMPIVRTNIDVVQMMGSASWSDAYKYGVQLIFEFSEKIGGRARLLNTPLLLSDKELSDRLMQEKSVRDHMEMVRAVDIALTGIGTNEQTRSTMVLSNAIGPEESRTLWETGNIAHVCGRPIDSNGNEAENSLSERLMAVELEDLKKIPDVVGVAGGPAKVEPILATLRGGFINTLVTDEKTAVMLDKKVKEDLGETDGYNNLL